MELSANGIFKTQLDNGLTVVLKEMHHAPVASFWVWYKVGSRNEKPGITGAAHWVEHMMFKGTPTFPPGTVDRRVSREGGRWNAFTWIDFTAYFETMPSDRIELGLQLESDRMVNAIMTEEETGSERTVIISERHMNENQPMWLLREEVSAAAFRVHPYHHAVIGDEVDLEHMTRDDLYGFYRRHYAPNNATVVVVGDFDSAEMLNLVKKYFGDIAAGEPPAPITRMEPAQKGEREVTLRGPGDTTYLTFNFKAPAASDPDYFALALLNSAFTGGGSLGFFGSSTTNKSSRLYKALVGSELTVTANGSVIPTIDPFLYTLSAIVRPGVEIADVEAAISAEIERLATEPISQAELDKALKRAKVEFAQAGESISGQAQLIGMAESLVGDYGWFETALDNLSNVTLEDIERVRAEYLTHDRLTIGRYLPEAPAEAVAA